MAVMMNFFDQEQIRKTYLKDMTREVAKETEKRTAKATAKKMIADGEMSLEKISRYVPALTMEELKELESEVMQLS
jgi:adenylate kinase